jgi:methionyl-tRNA formyltransferase
MGTGEIGLPSLRLLLARSDCDVVGVVTQPDKPAGRSRALKGSIIKEIGAAHGLPVFQPVSLRKPDSLNTLQTWNPDLIVVMAFGQILPKSVLDLPAVACLNLHASLLPKYRGASPIHAVIAAGESETGISVMFMAEGLDTGDVLLMKHERILRRDTAGSLHDRLSEVAAQALSQAIDQLSSGSAVRSVQDNLAASYAGRLTRADAIIDWSLPAQRIERQIRAMNPWPVAWTTIPLADGTRRDLKVFSAITCRKSADEPGRILRADGRGTLIAAGEGAILIRQVQMEGRKRMPAGEWQLGTPLLIGGIAGGTVPTP